MNENRGRLIKDSTLKAYDLTRERLNELLDIQDDRCGICGTFFKKIPFIDHDHITDVVRGILCAHCNSGLGFFRDNVHILARAIVYLDRADILNEIHWHAIEQRSKEKEQIFLNQTALSVYKSELKADASLPNLTLIWSDVR